MKLITVLNNKLGTKRKQPSTMRMSESHNTQSIADYLAQLLKDKKQLAAFPNVFVHMERLLDDGKRDLFFCRLICYE